MLLKSNGGSMPTEHTRGQLAASQIKAHPEMSEQEIAAMIDAQIAAAQAAVREVAQEYLNLWDDGADFTNPVLRKLSRAFRDALV